MLKINLKTKTYRPFIDYAIRTCESISFVFEKRETNINEYTLQDEYNLISQSIVNKENAAVHPYTGSCFESADVCWFKINAEVSSFLKKANNIFDWDGKKLPEELCFFRGEKIWFSCVRHEKLLFIHNETSDDIDFFNKSKIKFTYEDYNADKK